MRKIATALACTLMITSSVAEEETFRTKLANFIEYSYNISNAKSIVDHVIEVSTRKKLDPTLVLGIISVESGFNRNAVNPSGATGLMQVLLPMHNFRFENPKNARALAKDPYRNIEAGTDILVAFNGDLRKYSGGAWQYKEKVYKAKGMFDAFYKKEQSSAREESESQLESIITIYKEEIKDERQLTQ